MRSRLGKFALIVNLSLAFCVPPACPQAKTTQPATHFTQGTITSIAASQLVLNQTVRGKTQKLTFTLNPQTQRNGNLAVGTRVTVQYREDNSQKIATAVRESAVKSTGAAKPASRPGSKS